MSTADGDPNQAGARGASENDADRTGAPLPYVIIAGFGVPGRAVAELLTFSGVEHCVIELNPQTVERAAKGHQRIMAGDATDEQVLRAAEIGRATVMVVAVPNEKVALEITRRAHALNPGAKILTRCHFFSAGLEARAAGATQVVIAEQVVATELRAAVAPLICDVPAPAADQK
jgi:CPA2 family monovalent cation:H+ antiporter-2